MSRRMVCGVVVTLGVVGLASCTSPTPVLESLFDQPQESDDVAGIDGVAWAEDIDPASTRLVGEHDGASYYAARSVDGRDICLVIADEEPIVAGCSGSAPFVQVAVSGGGHEGMLVDGRTSPDAADGWIVVGEHLRVR